MRPILSALGRNKFGAILIAAQIAVTLAFFVNSLSLIEQRLAYSHRPTGIDEDNVFVVETESLEPATEPKARESADLSLLRALDGVADAYITNDYPLKGGGWSSSVQLTADQKMPTTTTAYYFGDEHTLGTLGLKLVAGRDFTAADVVDRTDSDNGGASSIIVSKALADKAFPNGDALGKSLFIESTSFSLRIVGIVERLQAPFAAITAPMKSYAENSTIAPYRPIDQFPSYLVRAKPGQRAQLMQAAERELLKMYAGRTVRAKSMSEVRQQAYRGDHGLVVLLTSVCAALLLITAFGIVGLSSYWVAQRRRQIGIRRALGASRHAILRYFQLENLLIAGGGALLGIVCALGLNLLMVRNFEVGRIASSRVFVGALLMLALGQLAVLFPALRAAATEPALATREG